MWMYAYLHEPLCDYVDDECKNCKRTSTGGERDSPPVMDSSTQEVFEHCYWWPLIQLL